MKLKAIQGFVIIILVAMILVTAYSTKVENGWFELTLPLNDGSNTATHAGKIVLDAPAGKHGFLKVKDGHFYFEDGKRIRFWGTNLTMQANFPSHRDSERIANRLAKYGFNCVRLHGLDAGADPSGIFDPSKNTTLSLSTQQLDKLDYLIYQLKKKGIYINFNLLVVRKFEEKDGVIDAQRLPTAAKSASLFDRKLIELQKDYAKKLLTHYNPYTKSTYNNEPAIALLEVTNENSLFYSWVQGTLAGDNAKENTLPIYYRQELDGLWNQWLKKKYSNTKNLKEAWKAREVYENHLKNSGFEDSFRTGWDSEIHPGNEALFQIENTSGSFTSKSIRIDIKKTNGEDFGLQLKQLGILLTQGTRYTLRFKAKADQSRNIFVLFCKDTAPYTNYGVSEKVRINKEWQEYAFPFISESTTDLNTRLSFMLGQNKGTVWLDDIELISGDIGKGLGVQESLEKSNIKRTEWVNRILHSDPRVADNTEFYYSLEKQYFSEMQAFLQKNIHVQIPITGSNNFYGQPDLMAQSIGDYTDTHVYWDHPSFPEKMFDLNNFIQNNTSLIRRDSNISGVQSQSSFLGQILLSSLKEKPLVVSEWNHVFPNDYDYETAGIITSYALFHDLDGLFVYTFAIELDKIQWDKNFIYNWFDIDNNPGKMAQMPACAIAFIRGDLKPANREISLEYSKQDIFSNFKYNDMKQSYSIRGNIPFYTPYIYSIKKGNFNAKKTSSADEILAGTDLNALSLKSAFTSDTKEISWNAESRDHEYVSFNAPRFQGAVGFISNIDIHLEQLDLNLRTDCSVFLTSLDGRELANSNHSLLTLVARQKNTGQAKDERNGFKGWGEDPVLLQKVEGEIKIKINKNLKNCNIYALNNVGDRIRKKKIEYIDGWTSFIVGDDATCWYEITSK